MNKFKGFSLVEMMIGLVIITIAAIGVFVMMGRASSTAAIEQEQQQIGIIVDNIQNQYVAASNFNGVSVLDITEGKVQGVRTQGSQLISEFNTPIDIRPATIVNAHDAFDVVYQGLKSSQCVNLVPAVANRSHSIFIGSNTTSVQNINTGRITNEADIANQCSEFNGEVTFRFFSPRNAIASTAPNACLCVPSNESRLETCPPGQSGALTQTRSSTCTGGTPTCRTEIWSAWSTSSSTCTPDVPNSATPAVLVPVAECTPATDVRNRACPAGQAGVITDERTSTCASPDADPVWSSWAESSNSCAPISNNAVCQTQTQQQTGSCPGGQTGGVLSERSLICASANDPSPVWTGWTIINNTCTGSPGWTCQPRRYEQTIQYECNNGFYGGPIFQDQYNNSVCDSATVADRQTAWINFNPARGTCTACPAPVTTTQWVPRSAACPAGSAGSNTWEAQQSRVTSYNCPSGTRTLPAPTIGGWTDTGSIINVVDNCSACPAPQTDSRNQTLACPGGQNGSITQVSTRTRSYSCSGAGSWGEWGAWSGWSDSSNTCALPACDGTLAGNARNYMARYTDLWIAFGPSNYAAAYAHWNSNGYFENRQSCWGAPAATCSPSTETGVNVWQETHNAGCPANHTGQHMMRRDITDHRTRTSSCPDPYGAPQWGGWGNWVRVAEGGWVTTSNTCTPNAATCSPSTQTESNVWQDTRNAGCPANHTGAHMQRRDITDNRSRTSSCPDPYGAPVWGGWGNWVRVAEGAWVTTSNTCAPSSPPGGGVCPAPLVVVSTSNMDICGMGMPNVWGGNVTVTTTTTTTYDCSSGTAVGTTSSVRSNPPIGGCLCEVPPRNAIPLYPSGWRVPASGGRPETNYECR